jgi:hypothetical protein
MESITYVNEIDVRKIAAGQVATITLDSDPTKKLTGKVTSVANVGEQRPNADAKVFEVKLVINEADTTLRPGMTTGNQIETLTVAEALYVPIEAVNSEAGVPFVYRQSGRRVTKQEVVTGAMSDDEVVIAKGLEEDDRVLLSPPADGGEMAVNRLPGSTAGTPAAEGGDTAAPAVPLTAPTDSATKTGAASKPSRRPARPQSD